MFLVGFFLFSVAKASVSILLNPSLYLWTGEILKQIEEKCGGFISIDKETTLITGVKWAKLLVSLKGEIRPS